MKNNWSKIFHSTLHTSEIFLLYLGLLSLFVGYMWPSLLMDHIHLIMTDN